MYIGLPNIADVRKNLAVFIEELFTHDNTKPYNPALNVPVQPHTQLAPGNRGYQVIPRHK